MKDVIKQIILDSISLKQECLADDFLEVLHSMGNMILETFKNQKKILLFGNGGSASDAQHIAAEFTGRFQCERKGLPAIALPCNASEVSAIGNDYGFENIFMRQMEALGQNGDLAIGISTSGNSKNVISALKKAKDMGLTCIGWTGIKSCMMDDICDLVLHVPSEVTARIQEVHILAGHIVCAIVDQKHSDLC